MTEWNHTLTQVRALKKLSDKVIISYQVTSDGGGGLVSPRDFVLSFKKGYDGDVFVSGGRSVEFKDAPSDPKLVRAINGPGCQMVLPIPGDKNACQIIWVMDCDYKGWVPQSV